jgi:hypothetical protein
VKSIMRCHKWWAGARRASLVPPYGVVAALFVLVIALASPSACRADAKSEGPLSGKVELRFQRCRTGAPIPIVWEIHWEEQAIIEGQLDFDIFDDGNQLMGHFQIPDRVLSPGKNIFMGMLPALSIFGRSAPVHVRARITSGKRRFDRRRRSSTSRRPRFRPSRWPCVTSTSSRFCRRHWSKSATNKRRGSRNGFWPAAVPV